MANQPGNFVSSSLGIPAVRAAYTGTQGSALWASSTTGDAILCTSALAGTQSDDTGIITYGGSGVKGENAQAFGVGVTGTAVGQGGVGVLGNAQDSIAVQGIATTGIGVSAASESGIALYVYSEGSFASPQITVGCFTTDAFVRIRIGVFGYEVGGPTGPWDIASGGPDGVLNLFSYATETNVLSLSANGNVTVSGSLHQHSSRTLKENIRDLPLADAVEALAHLSPVQYQLRNDRTHAQHLGFIAEDMPDLLATPDRQTVCPMDLVALLTKVVRELQSNNVDLIRRIEILENSKVGTPD
jgi:Chaperone of endosialidase